MGVFGKLFSNKQNEEKQGDEDYVNSIITASKDEPLGVSTSNVIYAGYNELGGYYYLQTFIIGRLKTKTKTGAQLVIEGKDYTFNLNSDMPEFESESANPLEGYVTKIDFEIDKTTVDKLKRSTMKQIVLTVKKQKIAFNIFKSTE